MGFNERADIKDQPEAPAPESKAGLSSVFSDAYDLGAQTINSVSETISENPKTSIAVGVAALVGAGLLTKGFGLNRLLGSGKVIAESEALLGTAAKEGFGAAAREGLGAAAKEGLGAAGMEGLGAAAKGANLPGLDIMIARIRLGNVEAAKALEKPALKLAGMETLGKSATVIELGEKSSLSVIDKLNRTPEHLRDYVVALARNGEIRAVHLPQAPHMPGGTRALESGWYRNIHEDNWLRIGDGYQKPFPASMWLRQDAGHQLNITRPGIAAKTSYLGDGGLMVSHPDTGAYIKFAKPASDGLVTEVKDATGRIATASYSTNSAGKQILSTLETSTGGSLKVCRNGQDALTTGGSYLTPQGELVTINPIVAGRRTPVNSRTIHQAINGETYGPYEDMIPAKQMETQLREFWLTS